MSALQPALALSPESLDHHPHRHFISVIDLMEIAQISARLKPAPPVCELRLNEFVVGSNVVMKATGLETTGVPFVDHLQREAWWIHSRFCRRRSEGV